MKDPGTILAKDTLIRTHKHLDSSAGMFVADEHLEARRSNALGKISGIVMRHGGDVYWVTHADGSVAAYCWTEFELAAPSSGGAGSLWEALQGDEL